MSIPAILWRTVLFAILLSLITSLLICCQLTGGSTSTSAPDPKTDATSESSTEPPVSLDYSFRAELSQYLPYLNPEGGFLTLANKQNPVGRDYDPGKIVTLDTSFCLYGKSIDLEETTAMALYAMLTEMRANGITDVYATSGYRSYTRQETLFSLYCDREAAAHPDWTQDEVRAYVLTYSAYPGTSEHQTGLCVDLMTTQMGDLFNFGYEYASGSGVGFAETTAYPWLLEHAYQFGFILRYPQDKTDVTGYSYESWHYRFVGQAAARAIHDGKLTLEEYLQKTQS